MFKTLWKFWKLVVAEVKFHKARNERELREIAVLEIIEGHVEVLQAVEASSFKVHLFDLVVRYVYLLDSR